MCVGTSLERDLKELFRHASVSSTYPGKTGITVVLRRITVVLRRITVVLRHTFGFPFCQGLWLPYVKS